MIDFWATRHSNPYNSSGFTLVEIMIIVIVLGILVAIVLTADSTMLARSRDTERVSDVTAISKELEQYYRSRIIHEDKSKKIFPKGSSYPRRSRDYNENTIREPYIQWSEYNFANQDATLAPGEKIKIVNGKKQNSIYTARTNGPQNPTKDQYIYQPFDSDDRLCDQLNERCVRYRIYYQLELEKTPRVIDSLRQQ